MHNVVIDNRSEPLTQALKLGDSQAATFASFNMTAGVPTGDGVYTAGLGGISAPQKLFLLPYCQGIAGSRFSMRIYGWRGIDNNDQAGLTGPNCQVVVPFFLAEFACIACNRVGPTGTQRLVKSTEAMCDTITLTRGALGASGEIDSPGAGTNLIAFAQVELRGARFFQFDFQQTDAVPMNCLWARG